MYFMLNVSWMDKNTFDNVDFFEFELLGDADEDRLWIVGSRFSDPPPIPIKLVASGESDYLYPPLDSYPIPLMTRQLADVLDACGVSNIDYYETVIVTQDGSEAPEYLAFNLIGLIAAADVGKSQISPSFGDYLISADIDGLVVDPEKTRGALMFRLAESVSGIVVHESVKNAIEAAGIRQLNFIPPEDWAG